MSKSDWCHIVFHIYLAAGLILTGADGSWLATAFCFAFALLMMVIGIVWSSREKKSRDPFRNLS